MVDWSLFLFYYFLAIFTVEVVEESNWIRFERSLCHLPFISIAIDLYVSSLGV